MNEIRICNPFGFSRDIPQEYLTPTSRSHGITTSLNVAGGSKSLTNSPLLVGKGRKMSSALQGSGLYTRDRYSNVYGSPHHGSNTGHNNFVSTQASHVSINTAQSLSIPRNRRLSGSQQPPVWEIKIYTISNSLEDVKY